MRNRSHSVYLRLGDAVILASPDVWRHKDARTSHSKAEGMPSMRWMLLSESSTELGESAHGKYEQGSSLSQRLKGLAANTPPVWGLCFLDKKPAHPISFQLLWQDAPETLSSELVELSPSSLGVICFSVFLFTRRASDSFPTFISLLPPHKDFFCCALNIISLDLTLIVQRW